jgi:cobalt-zinc-cadmium efflux system protein
MGHDHSHHHTSSNLQVAFLLNLGFTVVEIIGGILTNSVAILSDAVHDLGDSVSLGLAWYLDIKSGKQANKNFSFGYKRFSLLGALINSIVLIAGSVYIIREAILRLISPEVSNADGMILFALLGIAVNGYAAWRMSAGKTMNEKVISWHLLEDVLGWVAVLVVGVVLKFYDAPYLDPALSLFITAYILWNVTKRLRETLILFLQGVPQELDLSKVERDILSIDSVESLHQTHVWSLDGEEHVFTSHVRLHESSNMHSIHNVKKEVRECMRTHRFKHHTIQLEWGDEQCDLDS